MIEQVQGMVSLLLILLLLVLLFLFLLVIMLKLRTMMLKLIQLVRTQTKGKSILGEPLKQYKKEVKNPRAKKAKSQKSKQKKQHLCHHCRVSSHTQPNCYKRLATQQSNDMIASGNQNQLQSSLAPLGDLLKAFMFLTNLNGFNSSPLLSVQGFNQRKVSSKVWNKKDFE